MTQVTLAVTKETRAGESRVALTPMLVKKYLDLGLRVLVEAGAGEAASFSDKSYQAAGAEIVDRVLARQADILLQVHRPELDEIAQYKAGSLLACFTEPYRQDGFLAALAKAEVNLLSMEDVPRISRSQSMDALSSQAGIAGYRAVIEAATHYQRFFPLLMTSAGTSKPAKVVVLGVGVAGLQAIATAKRLGAQVEAFDVRAETREQVISLGAKFIDIDIGEEGSGEGGYAKELSEAAKHKQQAGLAERLKKADVIITTAQIPGRPAPVLVQEEVVEGMAEGSVIVDMAAATGGNCPLSEADKVVVKHGVTIVGLTNLPALMATESSNFYARNLYNLLELVLVKEDDNTLIEFDLGDDIIQGCLLVHGGTLRKSNGES